MAKNVVTLKSGSAVTEGHWKWHHLVDRVWFPISVVDPTTLIFVPKMHRNLETRVMGHSRSSKIILFSPAPMTSY